jgi:hypothetical protein
MRKLVLEALKIKIQSEMEIKFPQYKFYKKTMRGDEKGLLRYICQSIDNLSLFIVFRPLTSEGIEASVGWSVLDRCPISTVTVQGESMFNDFTLDEMMVPLICISKRNGLAHWDFWNPSDELLDNPEKFAIAHSQHFQKQLSIEESQYLVNDAVEKCTQEIFDFGIPYLNNKIDQIKRR